MERLKEHAAAVAVAALAFIFLIVGTLALTVLKPAENISSSVTAANSIVMTRDGVLPLLASDVTVRAHSGKGAPVAIGVGTPGDVIGWIGDDAYTEVVGMTAERSVLKVEEHDAIAVASEDSQSDDAQSDDAQSDAAKADDKEKDEAAKDGDDAQFPASQMQRDLAESDMWLFKNSGTGSAHLNLSDIPSGRCLIAVSAAGEGDLELTLTWATKPVNVLAIVSFLGALICALVAGVIVLSRRLLASRGRERTPKAKLVKVPATSQGADADSVLAEDSPAFDAEDSPALADEPQTELRDQADAGDDAQTDEAQAPQLAEAESARQGAHGLGNEIIDQDPPEKVPTDTGVIDLTAIRPGVVLPSRRALREAREKGEEKIVIDGHEFDTGLIAIVQPEAGTELAQPQQAEGSEKSSWTSMMSAWLKKDSRKDES